MKELSNLAQVDLFLVFLSTIQGRFGYQIIIKRPSHGGYFRP